MRCTKCGNENIDGAKFCLHCGKTLKDQPVQQPVSDYVIATEKNNKHYIFIITIIVVMFVVLYGLSYFGHFYPTQELSMYIGKSKRLVNLLYHQTEYNDLAVNLEGATMLTNEIGEIVSIEINGESNFRLRGIHCGDSIESAKTKMEGYDILYDVDEEYPIKGECLYKDKDRGDFVRVRFTNGNVSDVTCISANDSDEEVAGILATPTPEPTLSPTPSATKTPVPTPTQDIQIKQKKENQSRLNEKYSWYGNTHLWAGYNPEGILVSANQAENVLSEFFYGTWSSSSALLIDAYRYSDQDNGITLSNYFVLGIYDLGEDAFYIYITGKDEPWYLVFEVYKKNGTRHLSRYIYSIYDSDSDSDDDFEENDSVDYYILPDSDSRYLDEYELDELTASECRLARNEIYARHGRLFDSADLQEYFNSCTWYYGYIEPEDFNEKKEFNKYEKKNSKMIRNYEKKMGYQ